MDYETPDGSQFSLREELNEAGEFESTLITAFVDGNAYVGRSPRPMDEIDEVDIFGHLEAVPSNNVFPLFPQGFTVAPPFNPEEHYLKAPQFTYEDRLPGMTFVAEMLLVEATVLEHLTEYPHPSIIAYDGVVVRDGRITNICLKRCHGNLTELYEMQHSRVDRERLLAEIREGVRHLHDLGLAHNDISPDNICIDANGHAIIVDFDSCLPFGEPLMKGVATHESEKEGFEHPVSAQENDFHGLADIEHFLFRQYPSDDLSYLLHGEAATHGVDAADLV